MLRNAGQRRVSRYSWKPHAVRFRQRSRGALNPTGTVLMSESSRYLRPTSPGRRDQAAVGIARLHTVAPTLSWPLCT